MRFQNKPIIFIAGLLCGVIFTAALLSGAYRFYRHSKKPKRVDTKTFINALQGPTITNDLKVFTASSLDRIFLDGKNLTEPHYLTSASITAARNEYESFQIVVYPLKNDLENPVFEPANLIHKTTGSVIQKGNITVRRVGYVQTREPYYPVKHVGYWPDPLMPREEEAAPLTIKSGSPQPFWVTIHVPKDAQPGEYTGTIAFRAKQTPDQTIPLQVNIYNFELSPQSSLKTAFDFYGHITKSRYPQGEKESNAAWDARIEELNEKFIIEMLKYRMNPVLNVDPTVPAELGKIDRYSIYGINNFSIGKRGGTFDNNWPTDDESIENLTTLYQTYGELLKLNNMFQFTYIYAWDEGEIGNPIVPKITGMLHRAFKNFKNMVCYHGFWDPDEHPGWGKDIDIWCFNIDDFKENMMRKLQALNIEMWMYISGPSSTGSPNLGMDFDSMDYRIVPWLCWKYDIKGFLYWCVNWWPNVDPFESAANTQWAQNANGLLFYPGKNGPIASIRTEVFRDGMEDYEYIQTLIKRVKTLKTLKLDSQFTKEIDESIQLMTVDSSIAGSMFQFTKDAAIIETRRRSIALKIEEIDRILAKATPEPAQTVEAQNVSQP